ncbi:helix-turn-helix transcriptional regulator [Lactococcus lactis]|uniref:helix-turn-helix domain-containing protein n=1 Tax=Lactococcus lactis TaxID=1358 RepID=UPI002891FEA4|nr:helix-turn-helix transcriptional regulator [Lactococcus lactis]MDT2874310.1 helix-turn-helix transcriptional regulator [Lactococcus lactis]MDT2883736.1 helix-turn-helix transcriptional regulator [Lactococcus lactis]MDT2920082.1 helix-turn-helix transcriptional regulator [Lactococcus lactis]MDT2921516.1 helix-turn-helix transcriptional regulator [Lactococcus lactis]MDT2936236.1 helix-turn-helix transcriptional regulator [Lactococcus lactis]
MEIFSERLIHLRHNHNLTQKEVSDSLELVYSNYNRYERGVRIPDNETIVRFANFFKVSPMYMLGFSHLMNGEEFLLDVLENIESEDSTEGLKAKYALEEYRKEFTT